MTVQACTHTTRNQSPGCDKRHQLLRGHAPCCCISAACAQPASNERGLAGSCLSTHPSERVNDLPHQLQCSLPVSCQSAGLQVKQCLLQGVQLLQHQRRRCSPCLGLHTSCTDSNSSARHTQVLSCRGRVGSSTATMSWQQGQADHNIALLPEATCSSPSCMCSTHLPLQMPPGQPSTAARQVG